MWDVWGKCGKYVKMRDFPHDCGMVDTYALAIFIIFMHRWRHYRDNLSLRNMAATGPSSTCQFRYVL